MTCSYINAWSLMFVMAIGCVEPCLRVELQPVGHANSRHAEAGAISVGHSCVASLVRITTSSTMLRY